MKLVCISDNWENKTRSPHPFPKKGEIYTYEDIINEGTYPPYFLLKEFVWVDVDGTRPRFCHRAFREVDSSFGQYCEDVYLSIAQFEEAMKEVAI